MENNTIYTKEVKKLIEEFGLRVWWADEVAEGNMTIEEALASQNAHDKEALRLREAQESNDSCTAEEFIQHLKFAESIK